MLFAFQKVITMKNNSLLAVYKALFIKKILRNLVIQLVGNAHAYASFRRLGIWRKCDLDILFDKWESVV